jgi:hypothetical protein
MPRTPSTENWLWIPDTKGTLIEDQLRELSVAPLRVLFTVNQPDRLVKVTNVELI